MHWKKKLLTHFSKLKKNILTLKDLLKIFKNAFKIKNKNKVKIVYLYLFISAESYTILKNL